MASGLPGGVIESEEHQTRPMKRKTSSVNQTADGTGLPMWGLQCCWPEQHRAERGPKPETASVAVGGPVL